MKTFKNLEEIKQYYNEKTNTYEFVENEQLLDVELKFDLNVNRHIWALDINAWDINALDIKAGNIKADNINAWNIKAGDIKALDIKAGGNIKAGDIIFYSVCFARKKFVCKSIKGRRKNNKYFCLDSDVVIKGTEEQ